MTPVGNELDRSFLRELRAHIRSSNGSQLAGDAADRGRTAAVPIQIHSSSDVNSAARTSLLGPSSAKALLLLLLCKCCTAVNQHQGVVIAITTSSSSETSSDEVEKAIKTSFFCRRNFWTWIEWADFDTIPLTGLKSVVSRRKGT